jgi:hypothetical protein
MAVPADPQFATRDFFSIQTTGGFAALEEH